MFGNVFSLVDWFSTTKISVWLSTQRQRQEIKNTCTFWNQLKNFVLIEAFATHSRVTFGSKTFCRSRSSAETPGWGNIRGVHLLRGVHLTVDSTRSHEPLRARGSECWDLTCTCRFGEGGCVASGLRLLSLFVCNWAWTRSHLGFASQAGALHTELLLPTSPPGILSAVVDCLEEGTYIYSQA